MTCPSHFRIAARALGNVFLLTAIAWAFAFAANAQQPEIVVQAGHASPVNAVSFSPDGKLLASGSGKEWSFVEKNVVKLWDVVTGRELRTLASEWPVAWIAFSPDNATVAAKNSTGTTARLWDVASGAVLDATTVGPEYVSRILTVDGATAAIVDGKEIKLRDTETARLLRTLASRTADFQKYLFSPDSTILACGGERHSIRLWDLRAGVLRTLVGHTDFPVVADFSPDSRLFASGGRDLIVRLWDVSGGREIKRLAGHTGEYIKGMHFSPDGKSLLSFDKAGFKLWDVATGRELVTAAGNHDDDFRYVIFNPSGDLLAAVTEQGVRLWAAATGKELRLLSGGGSLSFSPNGKVLLAGGMEKVHLWEVKTGKQLAALEPSVQSSDPFGVKFERAVFSPDSRTLAISEFDSRDDHWQWRLFLHDAKTGKRLRTIEDKGIDPYCTLVFSSDGKQIAGEGSEKKVAWDVQSGKRLPDSLPDVHYSDSPNGVYRVSLEPGGEIGLGDAKTGRELASLIGFGETDWLVATSEGFFDGSPAAWRQILWRFNNDTLSVVPLEAFFNEYYHPGLLSDVLAGKRPARPDGKAFSHVDRRQPQVTMVKLDEPEATRGDVAHGRLVKLAVDVTENVDEPAQADHAPASGARDVRLFRNGSLVKAWRGDAFAPAVNAGDKPPSATAAKAKRVRYEISVPIVAGANEFTAYAFNQANVKSADATLAVTGAEGLRRGATLHVLAVGINRYENEQFNLRFAAADAQSFAAEVKRQQASLHNFGQVETALLVDAQATKHNLLAALTTIARDAQPEDMVIVYFAGHGMAQRDQFFLIPHDLGYADERARISADGLEALARHGISDRELERALERVDAAELLLVIDACNSGQALEAEEKRRGPMNSKGLAQLAYEKGICVLTAAQSYQAAREVSQLGHGLLTYALVEEGLKQSAADSDPADNRILLHEWLDYATRRVPQMQVGQIVHNRTSDAAGSADRAALVSTQGAQRPRVFYRREIERTPLVVASAPTRESPVDKVSDEPAIGAVKARPLAVAIAGRTLADQPLPKAIRQQWRDKLVSVLDGKPHKLVNDPGAADWVIQVAALQRPDILYLTPSTKLIKKPDDAWLLMSPPGDEAIGWLKTELDRVSRLGTESLQHDLSNEDADVQERAILGLFHKGPAEDLKADIVLEQSGVYHTPNRTQAMLGTYGKMIERNRLLGHLPRFEHRGIMQHFDRVRRFTTVQRQGRGNGKDFVSLVGTRQAWQVVDLTGQVSGGRQNEVDFEIVGLRLDQNDTIHALNADPEALNYFDYLTKNKETPCLILENLVFTSYAAAQSTTVNLVANAKTALTADGAAAAVQTQRNTMTRFTAPVVRCYQMYQVKLQQNRVVELVAVEP